MSCMRLKVAASRSLLRVSTEVKSTARQRHKLSAVVVISPAALFLWLWPPWTGGRKNARAGSGTVDVEGVAVVGTLVATLAEEVHHVLRLTAEDQLSAAHDGYPAEHLEHTMIRFNKISHLVSV